MKPTIGLITPFCLSNTHGTGVQVLRLFADVKECRHLYWSSASGFSEYPDSLLLEEPFGWWKWSRGKGRLEALMGWLGLSSIWRNGVLIDPHYRALLKSEYCLDVAYVVVIDETSARKAVCLLDILGCSYVVHIMDLMHVGGLDARKTPGFARLLAGARAVFAISEPIRQQVARFASAPPQLLPVVRPIGQAIATPPALPQTLRIGMVGSLYYRGGLRLLAQSIDRLRERFADLTLVYAGPESQLDNHLPVRLRPILDYRGYMSQTAVESVLQECHLAFLPGPCAPAARNRYSKYSIPSRISDYLMAGLPIVAYLAPGSATEHFLRPLMGEAVRTVTTPETLLAAIEHFVSDRQTWLQASAAARTFALTECTVESVRPRLFDALQSATGRKVSGPL